MTVENHPTRSGSHSFEVVLEQFLDIAHGNEYDPEGKYTVAAPEAGAYTVEITVEPTADARNQEIKHSHCLDCGWSVSTAEYPRQEVSSRVVRHAVETSHDIDSSYVEVVTDGGDGSFNDPE
jgi:predicted small metal-binding protein